MSGVSFNINPQAHKTARTQEKIRARAEKGSTPGEKEAAESKLKRPETLPKIKEESIIERKMTAAEKAKEERLGEKTKESALPAMKKRYGEKKGEFELDERYKPLPIDKMTNKIEAKRKINRMQSLGDVIRKSDNIDKITKTINTHDSLVSRFKELENKDRGEKKSKTELEKNYELSSDGKYRKRSRVKEEFELDERHMTSAEKRKEEALGKKTASAKTSMMKQYGPKKGEQVYYAWKRKQAMAKEEYEYVIETLVDSEFAKDFEAAEVMIEHLSDAFVNSILEEYIEEKARGTRKKSTLHAYDVDETLFSHGKNGKPNVQVHVKDASGKRVQSLSNQEFNTHKLQKGHSYDFSEFRSAKKFGETSSPNKKVIKNLQRQVKRGENVHLITARSKFDDPKEFHGHLKKHGINIPLKNIHYTGGMKGGDIGDKKVAVANAIATQSKTKNIHMYDDAAKVHKSFEKEKQEHPTTKNIKTHLIKPNKSGEPTSRSYQATKEEMTAYEFWKQFID